MPRKPRMHAPGAFYHVTLRAATAMERGNAAVAIVRGVIVRTSSLPISTERPLESMFPRLFRAFYCAFTLTAG
jgi:hypothetical protein